EVAYHERIDSEKQRADELLATVLPRAIVRALKRDGRLKPQRYDDVAVLFCDVVGFTAYSEKNPPETVFAELETLIDRFEEVAARIEAAGRPGTVTISGRAWLHLRNQVRGRSLGFVDLKGKEKLEIIECMALKP